MKEKEMHVLRGIFFYIATILLATLFLTALVEGLKVHLETGSSFSILLYLIAITSFAASIWVFLRGKRVLTAASYH